MTDQLDTVVSELTARFDQANSLHREQLNKLEEVKEELQEIKELLKEIRDLLKP